MLGVSQIPPLGQEQVFVHQKLRLDVIDPVVQWNRQHSSGFEVPHERPDSVNTVRESRPDHDQELAAAVSEKPKVAYYSPETHARFGEEISRLTAALPIEPESNIHYLPNEEEYRARALRNKQTRLLEQNVHHDWPLSLKGYLAWQPGQIKECDYVCSLSPTDLSEVDEALRYFKGTFSRMLVLPTLSLTLLSTRVTMGKGDEGNVPTPRAWHKTQESS
jgi:hypothetical protein